MPTGKTSGALQLSEAAGKFGSIRGLAKEIDQDYAAVWRWINGERIPEYHSRKKIEASLGIPMGAWDEAVANDAGKATP